MQSWIIIGVLVALMSSAAGAYYYSSQKKIAQLIENNATLEANNLTITNANNQNVQTINDLQASYQQVQEDFSRVPVSYTHLTLPTILRV